ncbi:hypothetical protein Tco_1262284 [Tanacetum coccineum]
MRVTRVETVYNNQTSVIHVQSPSVLDSRFSLVFSFDGLFSTCIIYTLRDTYIYIHVPSIYTNDSSHHQLLYYLSLKSRGIIYSVLDILSSMAFLTLISMRLMAVYLSEVSGQRSVEGEDRRLGRRARGGESSRSTDRGGGGL